MQNTSHFFSADARERLIQIFPQNGDEKFRNLVGFISIASKNKGVPFVVPPELDTSLHEILAARDETGSGFERIRMNHVVRADLGETVGKKLCDLSAPLAKKTCKILEAEGFEINEKSIYEQPACTLTILG